MPYRSTSTPEYPPDGKSIGTCEQTVYEITNKNPRSNSKKIAQFFPQTCLAFCLRDFLLIWMLKIKKIQCYYESSNSVFTNEAECQCYESVNCISVKELHQIQKLLYVNWAWKSSQHYYRRLGIVLLIGWSKFPTNKKLYPDLASAHLQYGNSELFFLRHYFSRKTPVVSL